MATKARHKKTPMQLWVVDNRKRLGLDPADLAALAGVSEDTARGWESRGRPSEDAIVRLEQRFGVPAPRQDEGIGGDQSAVIAALERAIERQTQAIVAAIGARDSTLENLLHELGRYRSDQLGVLRTLTETDHRAEPMPEDEPEHEPHGAAPTRSGLR